MADGNGQPVPRSAGTPGWLIVASLVLLTMAWSDMPARADRPDQWRQRQQALAERVGGGFVVWESNRTGRWRLFYRNLDGSGFRQLSPEEKGREHYAPHISPDGRHVVYLSYPADTDAYSNKPDSPTPLHLLNLSTGEDRVIVDHVITYWEDRSVVWLDNDSLVYIGPDANTYRLDLDANQTTQLTVDAGKRLINQTLEWATRGRPEFGPYDAERKRTQTQHKFNGCQPYFTADGKWGFWMNSAGGPVKRIDLASGKTATILRKNDKRLLRGRSYIYFPMISRDRQLLAIGVSPNQHDHFKSDYEIVVLPIDPATLEVDGEPVRYSFDGKCDRFPDVYVNTLALGRHEGEAPLTLHLKPPDATRTWRWDFGDGGHSIASSVRHRFTEPGTYRITARSRDDVAEGEVIVRPGAAPAVAHALAVGRRHVQVIFDEPVDIGGARFSFASGREVAAFTLGDDKRTATLELAADMNKPDRLRILNVADLNDPPHRLRSAEITLEPATWPTNPTGVVYLFRTADKPAHVIDAPAQAGRLTTTDVEPRGRGRVDHVHAMLVDGGAFIAPDAGAAVGRACKAANALTVEALIQPFARKQSGPARIVSLSTDARHRNFTLGQEGAELVFRLRTPRTGDNGTGAEVKLEVGQRGMWQPPPVDGGDAVDGDAEFAFVRTDRPMHVVVTYTPGELIAYVDGKQVARTDRIQGDLSNWSDQTLLFGDEFRDSRDWRGRIEHVAIYNRALAADEVQANHEQLAAMLEAREQVPTAAIDAKLVAMSRMPTLEQIAPYKQALVVCEYEPTEPGDGIPRTVRVAHWALLDGKPLSIAEAKVGKTYPLKLQRFEHNPQLESLFISDTLEVDFDARLYFHVEP